MLRLGLTGGIGAGKSTVASALAGLGAVVVDADAISREVVAPGTDGLAEIVAAFGEGVLDADGALDRPALASRVFSDDGARETLNGIVHPRVGARTAELVAEAADDAVLVHDIPLLVENGMGAAFALVIVVDAPVEERVRRVGERSGITSDDARARIAAQADTAARRAAADVWIDNSGEADAVRDVVTVLWRERIVPFEANARTGTAVACPGDVVDADERWADQGRRLAARLALAGGDHVTGVEHVGPTAVVGAPAPDVLDLLVLHDGGDGAPRAVSGALTAAGYPETSEDGRHGSADPARPIRARVLPAGSDEAQELLGTGEA